MIFADRFIHRCRQPDQYGALGWVEATDALLRCRALRKSRSGGTTATPADSGAVWSDVIAGSIAL